MTRYHLEVLVDDMALHWAHHKALLRGGDGVTYVVSPRWKELSERYSHYPDHFPACPAGDDSQSFMDNQEGLVFCGEIPTYLIGQFDDGMIVLS